MGGKALNKYEVFTERKTTNEFHEIFAKIENKLIHDLNIVCARVKCYHNKKTHGDLDILLKIDHNFYNKNIDLKKYIKDIFNPTAIHTNGSVISFDYNNFQIDFIPISESNWEIAQVYYSYDPLGNAMGKTFHKLNLSYGWDGLKYKYRNFNGRNSHDITISKNPRKIFEFGGYNYDRYLKGFETIEEIFDFIIDGNFFNANIFRMENLNHIDRKRNRKRKSYHEFIEYIDENKITKFHSFFNDKSLYNQLIDKYFPEANFFEKLNELNKKNDINRQINEKFNGRLIMEWIPHLKGKELGNAITEFKKMLGDDYENFILNNTDKKIRERFQDIYYGKEK